jgi:D-sedoheptulose 7-phosphate isomerase
MDAESLVKEHFTESMSTKQAASEVLAPAIVRAAQLMTQSLLDEGRIFSCGNGGSAADSQHFAAELVNRFEMERPGLPAIALTTDSSR